jgi:integrase/recombinase XerD
MTGLVPLYPLQTALKSRAVIPAAIAAGGEHAVRRFLEFFGATIRNKNTRKAYIRAVTEFFAWLEQHGVRELPAIEPFHVAAYIEDLQDRKAKPTVKQHLAAVRTLFDWLVIGHVVAGQSGHLCTRAEAYRPQRHHAGADARSDPRAV